MTVRGLRLKGGSITFTSSHLELPLLHVKLPGSAEAMQALSTATRSS